MTDEQVIAKANALGAGLDDETRAAVLARCLSARDEVSRAMRATRDGFIHTGNSGREYLTDSLARAQRAYAEAFIREVEAL